jgi:hypothetical protein
MNFPELISGLILALTLIGIVTPLIKGKRSLIFIMPILVIGAPAVYINPFFQEHVFGWVFRQKSAKLTHVLDQAKIIGKNYSAVIAILGEPYSTKTHNSVVLDSKEKILHAGESYTIFRYRILPAYMYIYGPDLAITMNDAGVVKSYMINY